MAAMYEGAKKEVETWADTSQRYQSMWYQQHGEEGGRWEDYEPGYRYGWESANDPRYRGRAWSEVEPELRRDWESRHQDTPWERIGHAIRDAWENLTGTGHDQSAGRTERIDERRERTY